VSERKKKLSYDAIWRNTWFWRTTDQKEIDYIEEGDGRIYAFEFKWNPREKARQPKSFAAGYPDSSFEVVTPHNMDEFLL
jgi:hypothetical protein